MNEYIFFSGDVIEEFATNRFFQSVDFEPCSRFVKILLGESEEWEYSHIFMTKVSHGIIFHSEKINKKKGVLFDLTTFSGFKDKRESVVINIFQKVIKYAIRYFNGLPLLGSERNVSENLTLVYPFSFTAQKEVDKVYVDKNSSNQNRNEQNYLTVFFYGHNSQAKPSFASLNKVVNELRKGDFNVKTLNKEQKISSLQVTNLNDSARSFTIDSRIGLKTWEKYLTKPQLDFVRREVVGAERLEGAAGSGKSISMILRCIYMLTRTHQQEDLHIVFITHSLASKATLLESFYANCENAKDYLEQEDYKPSHSILITTLQEWSGKNLGTNSIEDSEYLDKDAADSKLYQYLYIEQAIDKVLSENWNGYAMACSNQFKHFLETASRETRTELFRYEISVLIKGRGNGIYDKYQALDRPQLCLPLVYEEDFKFAFHVYREYQRALESIGQFDSDDITLSALGQINTPIWKRRSIKEGYDVCFIDETQLFNLNELSVFHYLNKPDKASYIIYAIDKTQTFGEVGFSDKELASIINNHAFEMRLETIFRSSPAIVDLAFNVLASNATLFSNFENPLDKCSSSFTSEEENKCTPPQYVMCVSDEVMIEKALETAENYHQEKHVERGNILIIATTPDIEKAIEKYANKTMKPIIALKGKNDLKSRQLALDKRSFVLSEIDFVGGLEFDCVLIVGVDKGRVPPEGNQYSPFVKYSWHNRMYVAITRAKYAIYLFGNHSKGESPVMESAVFNKLLDCCVY